MSCLRQAGRLRQAQAGCLVRSARCFHSTPARSNHYSALGVPTNASQADIKTAFIQLSMKFHPDANRSPEAHDRFVQISEAYAILKNPNSRQAYDDMIQRMLQHPGGYAETWQDNVPERGPQYGQFWKPTNERGVESYETGGKRLPNVVVALIVVVVAMIGSTLNYLRVDKRRQATIDNMDAKDRENHLALDKVRSVAARLGAREQLRLLQEKDDAVQSLGSRR